MTTELQELAQQLDDVTQAATFDGESVGTYDARGVRQFLTLNRNYHGIFSPVVDDGLLAPLTERVRSLLREHIIPGSDSISSKLSHIGGGIAWFTIPQFVSRLIVASAILGAPRAAEMVLEWEVNDPIEYQQHYLLSGVSVEQPLKLGPMNLTKLPGSTDEIHNHIPWFFDHGLVYTGMTKLSLQCSVTFLSKTPRNNADRLDFTGACKDIDGFTIEKFCPALALACDGYVSWIAAWKERGDWDLWGFGASGGVYTPELPSRQQVPMTFEHLERAYEIFARCSSHAMEKRLQMAIDRWVKSKRPASLADKLIDLRIALEALYVKRTGSSELRFRLASTGAWHLGADFDERQAYQGVLKDAYDLASTAVHAGEVGTTERNQKVLTDAQSLCRRGILKRLQETEESSWDDLILGRGD